MIVPTLRLRPIGLAFLVLASAIAMQGLTRVDAQTNSTLTVSDPRPVAKGVETLISKYGYVVTYEDPQYAYQGDVNDVTNLYRKDLSIPSRGRARTILVPLGGSVELRLPPTAKATAQDIRNSLQQLVQSQSASEGGGRFAVTEDNGMFHVVPIAVRGVDGDWHTVKSILATPISLSTEARTEYDTFKAICNALTGKIGIKVDPIVNSGVTMGLVPYGPAPTYTLGAQDESANSVLVRALQKIGKKRTWLLYFDPTDHTYALNVIDLPPSPGG